MCIFISRHSGCFYQILQYYVNDLFIYLWQQLQVQLSVINSIFLFCIQYNKFVSWRLYIESLLLTLNQRLSSYWSFKWYNISNPLEELFFRLQGRNQNKIFRALTLSEYKMDPGEGTNADTASVTSFSTTSKVSSNGRALKHYPKPH